MFIKVPNTKLSSGVIAPAFCVSQHLCRQGPNGEAVVTAEGDPWLVDSADAARQACDKAGFKLLTFTQLYALSANIGFQLVNLDENKRLRFERGWFELSNGNRIHAFGAESWCDYEDASPIVERQGLAGFYCTRNLP